MYTFARNDLWRQVWGERTAGEIHTQMQGQRVLRRRHLICIHSVRTLQTLCEQTVVMGWKASSWQHTHMKICSILRRKFFSCRQTETQEKHVSLQARQLISYSAAAHYTACKCTCSIPVTCLCGPYSSKSLLTTSCLPNTCSDSASFCTLCLVPYRNFSSLPAGVSQADIDTHIH